VNISLRKIIPHPLPPSLVSSSDVWGEEVSFACGTSTLLEAQSGKGKSTLLHILYGMRQDFDGVCKLDGTDITRLSAIQWQNLRSGKVSLLFQDLRLFKHLSLRENIHLVPETDPQAPPLQEMCERLQVDHLLDRPVQTLSLGQRQRAALVRSLAKPFQWLFLDEPFSHLDEANASEAALLIKESTKRNQAGLLLTSLQAQSPLACDRCLHL